MTDVTSYRDFADRYAEHADDSPANAYYDRPAVLNALGPVEGRRVVELGCAGGALSEQLVAAGADVIGLDAEPRLVELARGRLGAGARFHVADLREPWNDVETASAYAVVASLVLHYLPDWSGPLAEARRCLVPGGRLVFSVHHPAADWAHHGGNYHDLELVSETWNLEGQDVEVSFYRRSLGSIFAAVRSAGFRVDAVAEPRPLPELADLHAEAYRCLDTEPVFLVLTASVAEPSGVRRT